MQTKSEPSQYVTHSVSSKVFNQAYDSSTTFPGKYKWPTQAVDVRAIEKLIGIRDKTIDASLCVSGDEKYFPKCVRKVNWLDIVSSAVDGIHGKQMIARVILGDKKFVNTENPRAIENVHRFNCKTKIEKLRSFKCHNWAYAKPALIKVLQDMERK